MLYKCTVLCIKALYKCTALWIKALYKCTALWIKALYKCTVLCIKALYKCTALWIKALYECSSFAILPKGRHYGGGTRADYRKLHRTAEHAFQPVLCQNDIISSMLIEWHGLKCFTVK